MTDSDNDVYVLPLWGEAVLQQVLAPCVPDEQQRYEILARIRDARLAEVEQIELAMGVTPRTSEIRRDYKRVLHKLERLENE